MLLLPNLLTLGRVLVIPFVVWLMLEQTRAAALWASVLFGLAALTDFLDGYIARRWGLTSLWGQFLDPVADKLIVMATTVTAVSLRVTDTHSAWFGKPRLPVWLVVLLLAREVAVTSLRGLASKEGFTIAVIQTGKWKTAFQLVGLIALILGYTYRIDYVFWEGRVDFVIVGNILLAASLVLSLSSGVSYMKGFVEAIAERHAETTVPSSGSTPRSTGGGRATAAMVLGALAVALALVGLFPGCAGRSDDRPAWLRAECAACASRADLDRCADGADNDLDGLTDCDDPDCASASGCSAVRATAEDQAALCADGIDQDGDGYTDCDDYDCRPTTACTPAQPEPESGGLLCTDGIDNDADGLFDCDDPDCATAATACEAADPTCGDGLDNDGDGFTDCQDFDCSQNPDVTVCSPPPQG